jgi:integrase
MPRRVVPLKRSGHTLQTATAAFLDRPDLSPASRRSYAQTLERLTHAIGEGHALGTLNGADVEAAVQQAWGHCAPATWNRHLATVRSFIVFCRRHGWLAENLVGGLDRRREPADRTKAIPRAELERLWRREDASVRERAFWRLCYETAGRAGEVLGLNVEDVDLANKRARVRSKGGDVEFLHFQSASARLLPKLIDGRSRGPLFLAERRPVPARAPAAVDLCPVTGHGRLSYRQAEALFRTASGGWTLHQLRHSALTHLAEANVALPLLMAKSRHVSLRSLQRYARPGPEAVAALTAAHDPACRRR